MPEKKTLERARRDEREGKAPSTQAGEFVREEMEHVREGRHGARSTKQAIAIGLSKARRSGVDLPPPKKGKASERTRRRAARDERKGKSPSRKASVRRSRAVSRALRREGRGAASKKALSRQAKSAARGRSAASRSRTAKKAAATRKRK
ncbi:MAG TPA: DUF6496 domain-containing protein [Thermoanaerobaculia bacterium]|nr:DUF6496 domain-containing protein [Thermoanaerobaculia bacterium]